MSLPYVARMILTRLQRFKERETRRLMAVILAGKMLGIGCGARPR